jgi:hypothetical protein
MFPYEKKNPRFMDAGDGCLRGNLRWSGIDPS